MLTHHVDYLTPYDTIDPSSLEPHEHAGLPWRTSCDGAGWGGVEAASRDGARWGGVEFASHPRQMYVATSDALYLSDLRAGLGDLLITNDYVPRRIHHQ